GLKGPMADRGISLGQLTASACPPLIGWEVPGRPNCRPFNDFVVNEIIKLKPTIVILGGHGIALETQFALLDEAVTKFTGAGIRVVILGPVTSYKRPVPIILADRLMRGNSDVSSQTDINEDATFNRDSIMAKHFAKVADARYVSILDAVCPAHQ